MITYDVAVKAFGSEPNLNSDLERAAFFAVWVFLIEEFNKALEDALA